MRRPDNHLDVVFLHLYGFFAPGGQGSPAVILEAGSVFDLNYSAAVSGVLPGMSRRQASQCSGRLTYLPLEDGGYQQKEERLIELCQSVTPWLEPIRPNSLFLGLPANAAADEIRELAERLVSELGFWATIGMAKNKLMARALVEERWLAAAKKSAREEGGSPLFPGLADGNGLDLNLIPPDKTREYFYRMPVEALWPLSKITRDRLKRYGFCFVGDAAKLPLDQIVKVFGLEGHLIHRCCAEDGPPTLWQIVDGSGDVVEAALRETAIALDDTERVTMAIKKTTSVLSRKLGLRQQGCKELALRLYFLKGSEVVEYRRRFGKPRFNQSSLATAVYELYISFLKGQSEQARQEAFLSGISLYGRDLAHVSGQQMALFHCAERNIRSKEMAGSQWQVVQETLAALHLKYRGEIITVGHTPDRGTGRREEMLRLVDPMRFEHYEQDSEPGD